VNGKAVRSKLDRVTAAAHAKHKATFDPQVAQARVTTAKSKEIQRRVSLGVAVNAETGEIMRPGKESPGRKKRHSQRKHTIMSTSAHVKRMKRSEEKKVCLSFSTTLSSSQNVYPRRLPPGKSEPNPNPIPRQNSSHVH
jgi:G3E family GTPase